MGGLGESDSGFMVRTEVVAAGAPSARIAAVGASVSCSISTGDVARLDVGDVVGDIALSAASATPSRPPSLIILALIFATTFLEISFLERSMCKSLSFL